MHEDLSILNPLGTRRFKSGGNRFSAVISIAVALSSGQVVEAAMVAAGTA